MGFSLPGIKMEIKCVVKKLFGKMVNNFKKVHILKNRIAKYCIAEYIVLKAAHVKLKIKRNLNKVHWETQSKYIKRDGN